LSHYSTDCESSYEVICECCTHCYIQSGPSTFPSSFPSAMDARVILQDLYESTGGSTTWFPENNWFRDGLHHCSFDGVSCHENGKDIRGLSMYGFGLTGSVPESIASLTTLVDLNLGGNNLSGPIPASYGQLQSLGKYRYGLIEYVINLHVI